MAMRRAFRPLPGFLALALLAAASLLAPARAAEVPRGEMPPTVLVTGANRGIGLEFVRQYSAKGWRVIATTRDPAGARELQAIAGASGGRVAVERLDVTRGAEVAALAAK